MRRIARRHTLGGLCILLAAVAASLALLTLASSSGAAASDTARLAAEREAARLLASVTLPGSAAAAPSPAEARSGLTQIVRTAAPDTVSRDAVWRVALPAASVRAFLAAHPPRGTRSARASRLSFVPRAIGLRLAAARLSFTVLAAGPRRSIVDVEAQVRWLVPRAAAEQVPAGAGELEVLRGPQDRPATLRIAIRSPALIERVRTLIDRLPPVQPGILYHCAAQFPEVPVVRFVFRVGGAGTRVLATAGEPADVRAPTTACDALHFSAGGRAQTPLLGGYRLLREVSTLLGRRLWTAPYAA